MHKYFWHARPYAGFLFGRGSTRSGKLTLNYNIADRIDIVKSFCFLDVKYALGSKKFRGGAFMASLVPFAYTAYTGTK